MTPSEVAQLWNAVASTALLLALVALLVLLLVYLGADQRSQRHSSNRRIRRDEERNRRITEKLRHVEQSYEPPAHRTTWTTQRRSPRSRRQP